MSATWELSNLRQARPRSSAPVICRTGAIGSLALVESADQVATDAGRTLTGTAALFDTWTEVFDAEGHYVERILSTAFDKTLSERGSKIPLLLDHGRHPQIGTFVLGQLTSLSPDANGLHYTARLHDGLPELLLSGLRSGGYGSSFRAAPLQSRYERSPARSFHNPQRLMEVTRTELRLTDVGPTSVPAYSGTEARLRSSLTGAFPAESSRAARPAWQLGDLHDDDEPPYWQLRRRDSESREPHWKVQREELRRGRTFSKA